MTGETPSPAALPDVHMATDDPWQLMSAKTRS
jgi:hypothetical protein